MELDVKQIKQDKLENSQDRIDFLKQNSPMIGVRHVQSLMLFLCVISNFLIRVNLSITIMAMSPVINSTDYYEEIANHIPIFDWPSSTRSALLSSFFIGYLLANFPAAVLGCRYDKKMLLASTMAVSSALSIVTPIAAVSFGVPALLVIRFVQGLSSAFLFPTIHGILAHWSPPHERSQLVGFVCSGVQFGITMTMAVSGVLSSSSQGWPIVFYLSGAVGLTWTAGWLLLGAESLSKHRSISQAEKEYIQASLADSIDHNIQLSDTPWKTIFTSLPVMAITVAHIGYNWGFWLLLTEMPTFIHMVLKFKLDEDGLLSASPYFTMFLLQIPVSYTADLMNERKITSMTVSRKMWNTISMWGSAVGLIALGYYTENRTLTIIIYVFTVAIGCSSNAGYAINTIDLSPNYAGIIMGITNAISASAGIFAPLSVGLIIKDETSIVNWRTIFISGAAVMFLCNLFYILFGSAKTQPWNSSHKGVSKGPDDNKE